MENGLIFKDWKERCSQLGSILTNLPGLSESEKNKISAFEVRVRESVDNPKKALTDNMKEEFQKLKIKRDAPDSLPSGAITHLDDVFRDVYWGRKRFLSNKYLDKGLLQEENSLDLISKNDKTFYIKNDEELENDYIKGTPDNIENRVRDTKSNYDLKSFDDSDMTSLYENQLKGYSWLVKDSKGLDFFPIGELVYCLVNNPAHLITNEMNSMYYKLGCPSEENDKWKEVKRQVERNCIFDIAEFKKENPGYFFENEVLDFDIPALLRTKKFIVETTEEDVINIKSRVMLSRIYLVQKEIEIMNRIKTQQP
jgi:hypothetical protein